MQSEPNSRPASHKNRRLAFMLTGIVFAMIGLGFASVPLYRIFCQITGFDGTTQVAQNALGVAIIDRQMKVRFDANVDSGLGWDFEPLEREITVNLGQTRKAVYKATNISDRTITASATFNVTPLSAGVYFNKIECFCFTETTLEPGESLEMPVVFFIDPELDGAEETDRLRAITLSYTFFEAENSKTEKMKKTDSMSHGGAGGEMTH